MRNDGCVFCLDSPLRSGGRWRTIPAPANLQQPALQCNLAGEDITRVGGQPAKGVCPPRMTPQAGMSRLPWYEG